VRHGTQCIRLIYMSKEKNCACQLLMYFSENDNIDVYNIIIHRFSSLANNWINNNFHKGFEKTPSRKYEC
jgi:hypothetical protein